MIQVLKRSEFSLLANLTDCYFWKVSTARGSRNLFQMKLVEFAHRLVSKGKVCKTKVSGLIEAKRFDRLKKRFG